MQVFQHNAPFFFLVEEVLNFFSSLPMFCWVPSSGFPCVFLTLLVRIILHCSGIISHMFEVLPGKMSRFSDNLMLCRPQVFSESHF